MRTQPLLAHSLRVTRAIVIRIERLEVQFIISFRDLHNFIPL